MTLRLVKSTVEYEGRFSEVWTLVDAADDLEPWPDGKRAVVGQPAPRHDGLARATGRGRYTTDVSLPWDAPCRRSPLAGRASAGRLSRSRGRAGSFWRPCGDGP